MQARHVHDWGKLLFAFTMLWAYFAVSQLIIVWSGDLPEEITFYKARVTGGWMAVSLALALFQFVVPFVFLLSANFKRTSAGSRVVALLVLAALGRPLLARRARLPPGGPHPALARSHAPDRALRPLALPLLPPPEGASAPPGERALPQGGAGP